jgi:hypothetical protein
MDDRRRGLYPEERKGEGMAEMWTDLADDFVEGSF